MTVVNILEPDIDLNQLVDRASNGEEVILSKDGKPVARVIPIAPAEPVNDSSNLGKRPFGSLKGQIWVADDFDELPEDIAAAFRGERP